MNRILAPEGVALLLGNEGVVRGALEAGIGAFSTYPGTPASEIGDTFAEIQTQAGIFFEYAVNEKVAVETVIGFSLSGWRAMAAMKHVGLNVAADAFMTFPYLGVDGGAVIVSADDPGCHSSQNEQDNRHLARMAGVPMLEPASPAEARDLTRTAFELSERLGLPILLRLTTRVAHMRAPVRLQPLPSRPVAARRFQRDPFNRVVVPAVARRRHVEVVRRLEEAARAAESAAFHLRSAPEGARAGILATGAARNLVRDAIAAAGVSDRIALLELGFTWPQPVQTITAFLEPLDRVLVVEEGTPFLEDAVASIAQHGSRRIEILGKRTRHFDELGELDPDRVAAGLHEAFPDLFADTAPARTPAASGMLPARPPTLCPGCPHRASYLMAREVVGPDALVATDIGCYTLGLNPPLGMGDLLVCMGSSISTGAALAAAQEAPVVAVIGDSTFFHAGVPALIHAVTQGRRLMVLVLDNRTTAMTGFQPHPGAALEPGRFGRPTALPHERVSIEALARACGVAVVETADPCRPAHAIAAIRRAWNSHGVSVVVLRSPCPQMAERLRLLPRRPPVRIVRERCRTCGNTVAGRHCGMPVLRGYEQVRAGCRLQTNEAAAPMRTGALSDPPCTAACPAQLCVQGYVGLVAAGLFGEAYELVRRRLPFPSVCAYICPHPCEAACVLGSPIAIRHLKRMAVRFGHRPGVVETGPATGHRVAVIGAGPAGLSAAETLRRAGHAVTVFEASDRPGGLLAHAIPGFRLPAEVVQREIEDILRLGVELRTGFALGRDATVSDLFEQGYEAVVLAIGLGRTVRLKVEGSERAEDALWWLRAVARGEQDRVSGDVVVIGGGNTAMDAARTAMRLGARSAVIVYRRSQQEMPAFPEEVELARRDGVRFVFQANPVRFVADGPQGVVAVFQKTSLAEPDQSGRRRPVPIPGSEFEVKASRVFLALGQRPVDPQALGLGEVETRSDGWLKVSPDTLMTSRRGLFACGDCAMAGPATVIEAIHQGQAVASSVDAYLRTGVPAVSDAYRAPPPADAGGWKALARSRADMPWSPDLCAWEGRDAVEIPEDRLRRLARDEAARCLQCGSCANCRACVDLTGCPALRFDPARGDTHPVVIESLCNGCGLCAAVCPNGAIEVQGG